MLFQKAAQWWGLFSSLSMSLPPKGPPWASWAVLFPMVGRVPLHLSSPLLGFLGGPPFSLGVGGR